MVQEDYSRELYKESMEENPHYRAMNKEGSVPPPERKRKNPLELALKVTVCVYRILLSL